MEMENLEERAIKFDLDESKHKAEGYSGVRIEAYIQGATDQKKIDICNACDAYCKICDTKDCEETDCMGQCNWVKKFRKAMKNV